MVVVTGRLLKVVQPQPVRVEQVPLGVVLVKVLCQVLPPVALRPQVPLLLVFLRVNVERVRVESRARVARLDAHVWRVLQLRQRLEELLLGLQKHGGSVLVLHVGDGDVQLVVGGVIVHVLVPGHRVRDWLVGQLGCLIRPAARHIAHGVTAAAQHEHRDAEALDVLEARRVPTDRQIPAADPVARQRVGAAAQHHRRRLEVLHHLVHDRDEDALVSRVVHSRQQRKVERVVLAGLGTQVVGMPSAGEEVAARLMEGECHDAVGEVEGLLDAVAVVDVNVHVQHARVYLEQLQDGQHDVVDVAEARRLALLGVVQPARPVQHDVRAALVDARSARD
mmetsp:Transcript_9054/g.30018  ORF Transcript_9054/g.30018 Transcript_9054/m.30018 type:complete len:336 (+) Transcript_9054:57-1064(+)